MRKTGSSSRSHGNKYKLNSTSTASASYYDLPMISMYNASKFAREGFTEAFVFEFSSQNVWVKNVVPHGGVLDANFRICSTYQFGMNAKVLESYNAYMESMGTRFWEVFRVQTIRPQDVANIIYEAATDGKTEKSGDLMKA